MEETDEILVEFLSESRDMIDDSVPKLIELQEIFESTGDVDNEILNSVFRTFHSIKGTAAFLEFNNINKATHAAENLLDLYRKGKRKIDASGIALLLRASDFMQSALDIIEVESNDLSLEEEAKEIISELKHEIEDEQSVEPKTPDTPQPEAKTAPIKETEHTPEETADNQDEPHIDLNMSVSDDMRDRFIEEADDIIEMSEGYILSMIKEPDKVNDIIPELFRQIHSFKGNCGFMELTDMEKVTHSMETELNKLRESDAAAPSGDSLKCFLDVLDMLRGGVADVSNGGSGKLEKTDNICPKVQSQNTPPLTEITERKSEKQTAGPAATRKVPSKVMRRDIRVDLDKLDNLINLVGELVIAQAMVTNNPDVKDLELENFERAAGHLDRIVRDLQDVAMAVRMIPISGSFRKMIRLVHDLSRKFGKKVRLDLFGEETEIDKTVSELIADPLVHIIRNAVDHGLETTQERLAAGKSETGTIKLEARHEGGEIWILIQDDGKGLDRNFILAKGIEKGLVEGDGSQMSDDQVYRLLFEPGFSTAKQVTDVSGRGVGMDVVRRNIEKLKGQIDVSTTLGKGSSFILKIPLTLAIIEGMMVRVGQAKYTIPMLSIRGCIRAEEGTITTPMDNHEVIKLREQLLPILRLYALHNVNPDSKNLEDGAMVIVEDRESTAAIFVDEILGQHQTVIKGLSNYMGNVNSVSGCTIMGDGDVSLILDPAGLVALATDRPEVFYPEGSA